MKLISIQISPKPEKKYRATFLRDGRTIHRDFGAKNMGDYTQYSKKDKEFAESRKSAYLTRHRSREHWEDPITNGSLSRWILWNKPSLDDSIADYKRRFNL
jgi:hypothetical protein